MKNEKDNILQNSLKISHPQKKLKESSPKKQLNYSFTKEFINTIGSKIGEEEDEKNVILAKSHFGLGDFIKMQEQILGEYNEVSSTVLDEKIKRNICAKGFDIRKIKTFVNQNDIDVNDIEKNSIDENNNFLKIRELPEISQEDFDKMKYNLLNDKYLDELKNFITYFKHPVNSAKSTLAIGALFPLERLIEFAFNNDSELLNQMITKHHLYGQYIYNYRTIKGDGNCYYRAVMFRYFEIIIFNKEISLLRNIIIDMEKSFNSDEIISRKEIKMNTVFKAELPLKIMIIIFDLVQKDDVESAYYIFLKSLLICPIFDFGLIFYFRYIMYKYIKENEDKLYLQSFPIKIGNLLPSKYETEAGEFLFDSFYQNYLLKMFMDAEKIIVYLTPFVLGMNLDIIIFNDESEVIKKINYEGKPKYTFDEKIFLMNRKNHYELIYTKNDNDKYVDLFQKYINNEFLKSSLILSGSNKINDNKISIGEKNENKNLGIKKKTKIIKRRKKKSFDKLDTLQAEKRENKSEIIRIKKVCKNARFGNINSLRRQSMEIDYQGYNIISNSIYNDNNKIINYNEKSDEIEDEETTKETTLTSSDKNKNINEENKNVNNITKKIYKKNLCVMKPAKSFRYKTYASDETTKKVNHININENSRNIILSKYSSNLNNTQDNSLNSNVGKNKPIKKKKIMKLKDNSDIDINDLSNIHFKQKSKVSSTGKRDIIENNKLKNIEIKKTPDLNNKNIDKPKITSLTLEKGIEKKKVLIVGIDCEKCHKPDKIKQKKDQIFSLCKECAQKEITEKFCEKYLSYINDCLKNQYKDDNISKKFKDLLKSEVNINKKNISLEYSLYVLSKYQTNNNIKSLNEESINNLSSIYNNIFNEVKKNICLICCHKIDNNSENPIVIPCGCHFCSEKHLEFYLKAKNPILKEKGFLCYCSYKYDIKDIFNLGLLFIKSNNNSLNKLKKNILDYLNSILSKECCICINKEVVPKKIRYKDENEKNNEVLSGYKELKHFFCQTCSKQMQDGHKFLCKICDKNHIFTPKNK